MFAVIWEYDVPARHEGAFAELYGRQGEWVALFRGFDGYIGTELLRDSHEPVANEAATHDQARLIRFVTIDRWTSHAAYEAFLTAAESRYAHIDALGDTLTFAERCLGRFSVQ